ncbi:hypothetical protein HID58_041733 [Brassica napus]|uniref:Uncharacterized protein n=1 Tax=Brassica napus TaxID=3708 RepID=A0ABQ8BD97_BRANA|nr:hypothetical protein HID58_041733 [Brassica napus]
MFSGRRSGLSQPPPVWFVFFFPFFRCACLYSDSGMRKLRQFHRRRLDSGGWRLSKPCVAGFWISIFIHGGLSVTGFWFVGLIFLDEISNRSIDALQE